jgi:hypothetical protein
MKKSFLFTFIALTSVSVSLCAIAAANQSNKVFMPVEAANYSLTLTIPSSSSGSKTITTPKGNKFKYSYERDYDSVYNNTSIKSITGITCTYSGNGTAVICLSNSSHPTIDNCSKKSTISSGSKYTTSGYHYFTIVVDPELWVDINISKVVVNYTC